MSQSIKDFRKQFSDAIGDCALDSISGNWIGSFGQVQSLVEQLYWNANCDSPGQSQWRSIAAEVAFTLDCWRMESCSAPKLDQHDFTFLDNAISMLYRSSNVRPVRASSKSTSRISTRKKTSVQLATS